MADGHLGHQSVDGQSSDIDIAFEDIQDKFEYTLMGYVELRYGRWSFAIK